MSHWESAGKSDEWFTPPHVFDALGVDFDLDVATPAGGVPHVPARQWYCRDSLSLPWFGFVWMNPPFGARNGLVPWLDKFFAHGNGVALVPDRTSAPWFQDAARRANGIIFVRGKIRFLRPDGSEGVSPSTGTALLSAGEMGRNAITNALNKGYGFGWVEPGA